LFGLFSGKNEEADTGVCLNYRQKVFTFSLSKCLGKQMGQKRSPDCPLFMAASYFNHC